MKRAFLVVGIIASVAAIATKREIFGTLDKARE